MDALPDTTGWSMRVFTGQAEKMEAGVIDYSWLGALGFLLGDVAFELGPGGRGRVLIHGDLDEGHSRATSEELLSQSGAEGMDIRCPVQSTC